MRRMHAVLLALLLAGGLTRDIPLGPARAESVREGDMAPARISRLAPVRLPEGARRSTDMRNLAVFGAVLRKLAANERAPSGRVELLVWPADATPMRDLPRNLKDAGYAYAARPSFDAAPGRITAFRAAPAGKGDSLQGMWIETDTKNVLLAWTARGPGAPAGKDVLSNFELLPMQPGGRVHARQEKRAAAPAKTRACLFLTQPSTEVTPSRMRRLKKISCAGRVWVETSPLKANSAASVAGEFPGI